MAGLEDYIDETVTGVYRGRPSNSWRSESNYLKTYNGREVIRPLDVLTVHPLAEDSPSVDDSAMRTCIAAGCGLASLITETLLVHPFIVLRRQCQVNPGSNNYHIIPFTLVPIVIRLHQTQGINTLWKGVGSVLLVKGMMLAVEDVISKITPWPKEITWSSSLKAFGQHILLKCVTLGLATPFFSASLVETVQSEIASESPGILDVFRDGAIRLVEVSNKGRLIPIYSLLPPTIAHGICKYLFTMAVHGVTSYIMQIRQKHSKEVRGAYSRDFLSEEAYKMDIQLQSVLVSSFMADVLFYPWDTVICRLHLQGTRTIIDNLDTGRSVTPLLTGYSGAMDCYNTIISTEGPLGLYKGFGALLLEYTVNVVVAQAIKWVVTEFITAIRPKEKSPRKQSYRARKTAARTEINNEIVLLRQHVRQARICVVNKLIREAKRLRTNRGSEKQLEKNKNKADKFLREVSALKRIKDDEISKFGIVNLECLQEILQNSQTEDESRAMTKVVSYKSLKEKIIAFKEKFPDYQEKISCAKKKQSVKKRKQNSIDQIQEENSKLLVNDRNEAKVNIYAEGDKNSINVTSSDCSQYTTRQQNVKTDTKYIKPSRETSLYKPDVNKSEKQFKGNAKYTDKDQTSKSAAKVISNEAAVKRFTELLQETKTERKNDSCKADNRQSLSRESVEITRMVDDFFLNSDEIEPCLNIEIHSQERSRNVGDSKPKAFRVKNERERFCRDEANEDKRNNKVRKINNEDTSNDRNSVTKQTSVSCSKQNKITSVGKANVAQGDIKNKNLLENKNLHPSWAARRKQQEIMKQGFQGKKIRFDEI
ncbi:uncharacterized protein LOC122401550 [Colletes gigas]|uniref:uncharacterized protein LOC122401550 n=1 Tax=Colletes gigas TaxID=935657 RepID=UPI001C9A4F6F|nr:uncharacterized protein LOC122401550 [Colletes gigas]